MQVFRDQRMLQHRLLPQGHWNMIRMPAVIITNTITVTAAMIIVQIIIAAETEL